MKKHSVTHRLSALCAAAAVAGFALSAAADPVADFYRGRTISFTHTGGSGGTFAAYSRLLAEHMKDHVPGHPNIIVQFKSGGGGIVGMNYLYNAAPRDGSFLLMPIAGVEVQPFLFPDKVRFDLSKVEWIGNMLELQSFISVWHTVPVKSWRDATRRETILGATGKGSETYLTPATMNALLGTRFKVITGYKGIMKVTLAMEKGELEGRGGGWTPTMRPQWFQEPRKIRLLVQIGRSKLDEAWPGVDISQVPLLTDLAKSDDDRKVFSLLSRVLARPLVAPPGVPAERLAALRTAFDATMKDPAFLADAKQRKLWLSPPMGWREVTDYVKTVANMPPRIIDKYKKAIGR